eukprot:scaffold4157_cov136-Cylindrotheca_fusiformis.AAC.18
MKQNGGESKAPDRIQSWSDPMIPPSHEAKTKSHSTGELSDNSGGVDIPDFLQPLLGLDFVPFAQLKKDYSDVSKSLESEEIPESKEADTENLSFVTASTPVPEKKSKGILKRLKKRTTSPRNVDRENAKAPFSNTKVKGEISRASSLVRSESDSMRTDENSVPANPTEGHGDFRDLQKSLTTRHDLMKVGMIQGTEQYTDEKEFEAIIKLAKEKRKIKPGLLKRMKRSLGKGNQRPSKLTDSDMKALGLAPSGSMEALETADSNSVREGPPQVSLVVNTSSQLKPPDDALEHSDQSSEKLIRVAMDATKDAALETKKNKSRRLFRRRRNRSNTSTSKDDSVSVRQRGSTWNCNEADKRGSDPNTVPETLGWLKNQQNAMQSHQVEMQQVQAQIQGVQDRSLEVQKRISTVKDEILRLQKAMERAELQLRRDLVDHQNTQSELARLENVALQASEAVLSSIRQIQAGPTAVSRSTFPGTPSRAVSGATTKIENTGQARPRAMSDPPPSNPKKLIQSDSFMRMHDFKLEGFGDRSDSSLSSDNDSPNFVFVDHNITPILQNLCQLGFGYVTDESDRFVPKCDTERILAKYRKKGDSNGAPQNWKIHPWNSVRDDDVLVWMGKCGHDGFGSNWPVCKARGLVRASPRALVEFLLDSTRVKEYNKMSQGRDDLVVYQGDLDTTAEDSFFGFPGVCKVVRSRNKPRLLPKVIEITSLLYAKPLEDSPGSYLIVNRSVFDDNIGTLKNSKDTMTSEMLLGANLIRPTDDSNEVSEFSSVTHIYPPGVPESLAKRVAPSSALNMIKDIQKLFA